MKWQIYDTRKTRDLRPRSTAQVGMSSYSVLYNCTSLETAAHVTHWPLILEASTRVQHLLYRKTINFQDPTCLCTSEPVHAPSFEKSGNSGKVKSSPNRSVGSTVDKPIEVGESTD